MVAVAIVVLVGATNDVRALPSSSSSVLVVSDFSVSFSTTVAEGEAVPEAQRQEGRSWSQSHPFWSRANHQCLRAFPPFLPMQKKTSLIFDIPLLTSRTSSLEISLSSSPERSFPFVVLPSLRSSLDFLLTFTSSSSSGRRSLPSRSRRQVRRVWSHWRIGRYQEGLVRGMSR